MLALDKGIMVRAKKKRKKKPKDGLRQITDEWKSVNEDQSTEANRVKPLRISEVLNILWVYCLQRL